MKWLSIAFIFILFTNQSQALAKDHFEKVLFKNPREINRSLRRRTGVQIAPWKAAEKEAIKNALVGINKLDSRLLNAATKDKELIILRTHNSEGKFVALTIASRNVILIADTFPFKSKKKSISDMIHELVHILDLGSRVSHSKEWGEYAGPIINRIKTEAQFYSENSYKIYLKKSGIWPSMYGCKNLSEALAVYCTKQITEKSLKKEAVANQMIANLVDSPEKVLKWKRLVRKGNNFYFRNHYSSAAKCFLKAKEIEPSNLALGVKLVDCLLEENNYKTALTIKDKCLEQLKRFKSLETNKLMIRLSYFEALIQTDSKQYKQLIDALDRALESNPSNKLLLEIRAICADHYEHSGTCLLNSYRAKGYFGDYITPIFGINTDPKYVHSMVNRVITEHPNSGQALRYRACYYEQLAGKSTQKTEKVSYLSLALKDYTNSLQFSDTPIMDTMVRCSQIQVKLKNYNQAKYWLKRAKALDAQAILPQIVDVLINESTGNTKEAKVKSKNLFKKINKLKTIKRKLPLEKSFPTLRFHYLFPYQKICPDFLNIG